MSALTVAMLWVTITSALDMSRTEGYCLYGTLLLRPHFACTAQVRAHRHINVCTDIKYRSEKKFEFRKAYCTNVSFIVMF